MFTETFGFKSFSIEHGICFLLTLFVLIACVLVGRRQSFTTAYRLGLSLAWAACGFQTVWMLHKGANGTFSIQENFPLHLCNVCSLLSPFLVMPLRKGVTLPFEILYYWVLTGTLQGILTPDMDFAFPYIGYVKYWVTHSGLVILVLYGVLVLQVRPSWNGVKMAFLAIQVWACIALIFNYLTGSNYGYLMHKPSNGSLFDYCGDHYILVAQVAFWCLFCLFWLPFRSAKQPTVI
ncbi:MAG: hypothetical protein RL329_3544 [Bacteroidota bacterium]|jgi:hypothetical integral membrane protein (TIGR02206 family)